MQTLVSFVTLVESGWKCKADGAAELRPTRILVDIMRLGALDIMRDKPIEDVELLLNEEKNKTEVTNQVHVNCLSRGRPR